MKSYSSEAVQADDRSSIQIMTLLLGLAAISQAVKLIKLLNQSLQPGWEKIHHKKKPSNQSSRAGVPENRHYPYRDKVLKESQEGRCPSHTAVRNVLRS